MPRLEWRWWLWWLNAKYWHLKEDRIECGDQRFSHHGWTCMTNATCQVDFFSSLVLSFMCRRPMNRRIPRVISNSIVKMPSIHDFIVLFSSLRISWSLILLAMKTKTFLDLNLPRKPVEDSEQGIAIHVGMKSNCLTSQTDATQSVNSLTNSFSWRSQEDERNKRNGSRWIRRVEKYSSGSSVNGRSFRVVRDRPISSTNQQQRYSL